MRTWLAMKLLSRNMAAIREGDYGPTLKMDAEDVWLHFPGENSWAGDHRGKEAVGLWLARFVKIGLQIYPDEAMVKGGPWRMTMAVRGRIFLKGPDGDMVYENRYVIWGHLRWGKLVDYEAYEDTQKSEALDVYLAEHAPLG